MDKPDKSDKPNGTVDSNGRVWRTLGSVSAIGTEFATCTVAGFYGGTWLGNRIGNREIWVVVGLLVGMATGAAGAITLIRRIMRENDE